ncbi:hypothetical protein H2201_006534 [Coniosporium apollinis]|uniref:ENTH domain-containing protein n=1 Tax=Coniosporium apollinis TaxID=61459 RepID=A0ABQ9NLI6_9PEZI|nr:hypothetical protein H2201_006534 [Coniosporium apollinis]
MASSFEKSVKGATKIKAAAPKSKYVEHILVATHAGESGVAEIFRALQNRLRDSTWTIVFKSLIVVHLMIREGEQDVTLAYLASAPQRKLAINNFTGAETQGGNIRAYSQYLTKRAIAYASAKVDYVRGGEGRLKRLTIDKGLLRETESVQEQINALLKCEFLSEDPENEITLCAFRLLTMDLIALFHVMNEGTINVLEHFFEMSHPDAERALMIYKEFTKQTDRVVQYLSVARLHEHSTRLEIPKIKHAPTVLASSLEEYLKDKDFEINRRQYLATQQAKKGGRATNGTSKPSEASASNKPAELPARSKPAEAPAPSTTKGPAPDLIDFFESIEDNQQQMAHQPSELQQQYPQQTGMPVTQPGFPQQATSFPPQQQEPYITGIGQSTNPFGQPLQQTQPLQQDFTGAGFGGYTSQPQSFSPQSNALSSIPQDGVASFSQQPQQQFPNLPAQPIQPQSTNPFRQSMMPNATGVANTSNPTSSLNRSSTNPFARSIPPQQQTAPSFPPAFPQQESGLQPLQPAPTGTNPFARNPSPAAAPPPTSAPAPLVPNPTGSTNPFRQAAFVNQQTGQGWQAGPQATMGGLEQLETVPVFPRPGQPAPQQQQGWL